MFFVLIGVALFAALSYVVTQSGQTSGSRADRETEQLQVNEILQYGSALQHALQRMVMSGGCRIGIGGNLVLFDGTVGFDSSEWANPGDYDNPNAPADNSCDIFDPVGGGVDWQPPPVASQSVGGTEYLISGGYAIEGIGTTGLPDGDSSEVTLITRVTETMCLDINDRLGVTNPGGSPPGVATTSPSVPPPAFITIGRGFVDTATFGSGLGMPELTGKTGGCLETTSDGVYLFYQVLWSR